MGGGSGAPAGGGPTFRSVGPSEVNSWVGEHEDQASTYALNPPDAIVIGGVTFTDISGGAAKSVTGARTTSYTTNYQSSQQASNGEYPVVQVVVNETIRRSRGSTTRLYTFDRRKTGLW